MPISNIYWLDLVFLNGRDDIPTMSPSVDSGRVDVHGDFAQIVGGLRERHSNAKRLMSDQLFMTLNHPKAGLLITSRKSREIDLYQADASGAPVLDLRHSSGNRTLMMCTLGKSTA